MCRPIARLLSLLILSCALATPVSSAEPDQCDDAQDSVGAPYSMGCGAKSVCVVSDLLEIKPVNMDTAKGLKSLCLRFTGANGTKLTKPLEVNDTALARPTPLLVPLAPRIERWILAQDFERLVREAPEARLPMEAILTDGTNRRFKLSAIVDVTALWTNGLLPLRITAAECSPCRLGGSLRLTVPQLANWKDATKGDPDTLALVLGNTKIPALKPDVSLADGALTYQLRRQSGKSDNTDAWNLVMRQVLSNPRFGVKAGLADAKGTLAVAPVDSVFDVPGYRGMWSVLFLLGIAILIGMLGRVSGWIAVKDRYEIPDQIVEKRDMPFSLGRSQMLLWTVVVMAAWFFIGMATGDWLSFNESCWVLLGVGTGTVMGSIAIGRPAVLTKLIDEYNAAKTANQQDDTRLHAARSALMAELKSKGWLADVSADYGETMGLHRMQSMLFTFLLAAYFGFEAYQQGAMPQLSSDVLALLGISGGAYVGFKLAGKAS
jgi:hypothetical protein